MAASTPRVLVLGWYSFLHGEATAGDVLAGEAVEVRLRELGIAYDTAWSPVFRPAGLRAEDADPERYSHVVFACGPVHGRPPAGGAAPLMWVHERFARCRRIAVGVSVPDPADPAAALFDVLLPRDAPGERAAEDLSLAAPRPASVAVAAVVLAPGQDEYGPLRRHEEVAHTLTAWLNARDVACLPVDTRLAVDDWRLCATPGRLRSVLRRVDVVVTTRLHGLVLGLDAGVPVLAVDPVAGGAKVGAQAGVLGWPVLSAEECDERRLDASWAWCVSPQAREHARRFADGDRPPVRLLDRLAAQFRTTASGARSMEGARNSEAARDPEG